MCSGLYINMPLLNIERSGLAENRYVFRVFLSREPEERVWVFILLEMLIHRVFGQVYSC